MNYVRSILFVLSLIVINLSWAQPYYNGINLQGQLVNELADEADFRVVLYSTTNDTIWLEDHYNVPLSESKSFHFVLGFGINTIGTASNFQLINWFNLDHIEIYRMNGTVSYQISVIAVLPQPYAFHSQYVNTVPKVINLIDVSAVSPSINNCLKFNGINYGFELDNVGDSIGFAYYSQMSQFSDSTNFALMTATSIDSSNYSYYSDTSNFALNSLFAASADTANYADSVLNTSFSINNWGLFGNGNLMDSNFIGTNNSEAFNIRTNSNLRISLGLGNQITNTSGLNGFGFYSNNGMLIVPNNSIGVSNISGSFLYFSGEKSAFIGGENNTSMDSSIALGSFSWGLNNSLKGPYVTIFGCNNFADSSTISGISYGPNTCFVLGKNCIGSQYSVAIGDSARATFIRNVAIGKNVYAGSQSASVAIGNNVFTSGATSWAMGKDLLATGNFATVLGTNAGTSTFKGGFTYGDLSSSSIVTPNAIHQFVVRAAGGYIFYSSSDLSMGVELLPGSGSWNMISDRTKKENIYSLDYAAFSTRYLKIPIYSWAYIGQSTFHLGPMAQDFEDVFEVGEYKNYINMLDIDGVVILGIKELNNELNNELKTIEISEVEKNIESEKIELEKLNNRIKLLYEKVNP